MKIEVKHTHIRAGIRGSYSCCPIALALREQLETPGANTPVWVGSTYIHAGRIQYLVDGPVRDFISDFDSGVKVAPTAFELMEV